MRAGRDSLTEYLSNAAAECMAANDRGFADVLAEWEYWSLNALLNSTHMSYSAYNAKKYRAMFLAGFPWAKP